MSSPAKPPTTFGTFQDIDLRVARVVSAPLAQRIRYPCRVVTLDLGGLGQRVSVGQSGAGDPVDRLHRRDPGRSRLLSLR